MLFLTVVSEETGARLLRTRVFQEDLYQRQQETLIVWSDPLTGEDLALSFQLKDGCSEIWAQIEDFRLRHGGLASPTSDEERAAGAQAVGEDVVMAGDSSSSILAMTASAAASSVPASLLGAAAAAGTTGGGGLLGNGNGGSISRRPSMLGELTMESTEFELPIPTLSNLADIGAAFAEYAQDIRRSALAASIVKQGYVQALLSVFNTCEDLDSEEHLRIMFAIFKTLIFINDVTLMESLFSPQNIMSVIGVFECVP